MDSKVKETATAGTAPSAQKSSLDSCPGGCGSHKNPEIQPVSGKAMTGARYS